MARRHPKPTKEQNAGRAVRRAAEVLADRKWLQGGIGNSGSGMCAIGAINFAIIGNTRPSYSMDPRSTLVTNSINLLGRWLKDVGVDENGDVPSWNDKNGRTKEEVILYMNKFADEMDPQQP